ncbi:MAG: c-type cytochrome [Bacteroidetes bacterium]|nr:c-type cytochrome [Bacteroidota bacterium]
MEYHKIVLIHRILVSLFLLHYVVKGYFLIADKKETLAGYTAKTKIAEMVLSALFLASGIYLVAAGPALSMLMYIKLALVFASIPLAIIGFKKGNKILAIIAILFLIAAYGLAEISAKHYKKEDKKPVDTSNITSGPVAVGQDIYKAKCLDCHGAKGDAGLAGAKNLRITQLTDDQIKDVIHNGRPGMNPFPAIEEDQLNGLVAYIRTLK